MKTPMLMMVAALMAASPAVATTTITGTVPIPSGETLVIDVPSGETYTYSDAITGAGAVQKTGAGKLILSGDNTYEGGFDLGSGKVQADSATAFGKGTVTASVATTKASDGYPQIIFNVPGGEFDNDFSLNGDGSAGSGDSPFLSFNADTTLNGTVLFSRETNIGGPTTATSVLVNFNGEVKKVGDTTCGCVYKIYGNAHFRKPVKFTNLYAGTVNSNTGKIHLWSPSNTISDGLVVKRGWFVCEETNVTGSAYLTVRGDDGEKGYFDLNGFDQRIKYITIQATSTTIPSATTVGCAIRNSGATPATLTIYYAKSGSATGYYEVDDDVSIVIDAHASFKQVFGNRASKTTGDITLKSGNLEMTGTSSFRNVGEIAIAAGCSFVDNSTALQPLQNVGKLSVFGSFAIGDAVAGCPFGDATLDLELHDGATFDIGSETILRVKSMTVNGETVTGIFNPSDYPGVTVTAGQISVLSTDTEDEWTGNGATASIVEAANWASGRKPDTLGGLAATFAAADATGFTAEVDADMALRAMTLSALTGFSFIGSKTLSIYAGGITVATPAAETAPVYDLGAPMVFRENQTWEVPANATLKLSGGSVAETQAIGKKGEGLLEIGGENAWAGRMIVSNGPVRITGSIMGPNGVDTTKITKVDTQDALYFHMCKDAGATIDSKLYVSNAVIGKPFWLRTQNTSSRNQFVAMAGTTNYFKGFFLSQDASNQALQLADANTTVYFDGGMQLNWSFYQKGPGTVYFRQTPFSVKSGSDYGYAQDGVLGSGMGRTVFEVGMKDTGTLRIGGDGGIFDFRVDDVMPGSWLRLEGATSNSRSGSVVLLNGTKQRVGKLTTDVQYLGASYISGDEGSELFITNNTAGSALSCKIPIKGAVSLRLDTPGSFTVTNAACTSTGSLRVDRGTLTFAAGSSWPNAGGIVVDGTGRFAVETQVKDAFGRSTAEMALSDDGVVSIADGQTVRVRKLTVDGVELTGGRYSYATIRDENVRKHFDPATTGTLVVKGGIVLIVR